MLAAGHKKAGLTGRSLLLDVLPIFRVGPGMSQAVAESVWARKKRPLALQQNLLIFPASRDPATRRLLYCFWIDFRRFKAYLTG